jgi:hypothetical protein
MQTHVTDARHVKLATQGLVLRRNLSFDAVTKVHTYHHNAHCTNQTLFHEKIMQVQMVITCDTKWDSTETANWEGAELQLSC